MVNCINGDLRANVIRLVCGLLLMIAFLIIKFTINKLKMHFYFLLTYVKILVNVGSLQLTLKLIKF